jgi:hypothetical protein
MRTNSSTSHKLVLYSLTLTLFALSFLQSHESTLAQPTLICGDGIWTNTGNMSVIRRDHTATLLNNGKVLIIGFVTDSAELYDPATGIFSSAGHTLFNHGQQQTATRLLDGRVLITGGLFALTSAEIYDPVTGNFSPAGNLNNPRFAHSATLLPDGRVLIAGGGVNASTGVISTTTVEIYDPTTNVFNITGSLNTSRSGHIATLLPNGRVLVAGGTDNSLPTVGICTPSAELYDPATGIFSNTGNMTVGRCSISWGDAPVLGNGKVLILGGGHQTAELFDPSTGSFSPTGNLIIPRLGPSVTLLTDGRVLVAGGFSSNGVTNSTEIYDTTSGTFTAAASMNEPRQQHAATLLPDGRVLVTGGFGGTADLSSAELFSGMDTTPPVITNQSVDKPILSPPNHEMVTVTVSYNVTDNCGPVTTSLSVTSNESVDGIGDGNTAPDWEIVDAHHVLLRVERSGTTSGRVYTITITSVDSSGNSSSATVTVEVPRIPRNN